MFSQTKPHVVWCEEARKTHSVPVVDQSFDLWGEPNLFAYTESFRTGNKNSML
jgi:hypothetical protein